MSGPVAQHPDAPAGQGVRLYLLRHGEPARRDLFYGHADVPLSARGQQQALAQAELLAPAQLVAAYSSDLGRALASATAVCERHGLTPVVSAGLREMHLGQLENVPFADGLRDQPELAGRSYMEMLDFRMPDGGESVRDVARRVLPLVDAAVVRHAAAGRPGVVVVAHNTVTRIVLAHAAGLGPGGYRVFAQRYGAINRIDLSVVDGAVQWARGTIVYSNRDPFWRAASQA